ncbi:MAG: GTPase ObgE [Verrucomicrobia bacterium]|nr:GTPase ObgE [Verrucomicrobiota bacterium]
MFVDRVRLTLTAGRGGNGIVAWRREKYIPKGGPAGGDGGKGGSIYFETDPERVSLEGLRNRRIIRAQNGAAGGPNCRTGKNGDDLILTIPCGTLIKDALTGEILFDITEAHRKELMCRGGKGGKGNDRFKSPTNQAPNICTEGTPGEEREIELELKLIADIGLIGMPNAGKSSIMRQVTHLPVKIGAYPFTTLFPNLSYIQYLDQSRVLIADIPGIIEGAHADKGLGLAFLRHIERTSALVFVIDVSGFEGRDPLDDFAVLQNELASYDPLLLEKPCLVVLNKIDVEGSKENAQRFKKKYKKFEILEISALQNIGLQPLVARLQELKNSSSSLSIS